MQIFIHRDGKQLGPFTEAEIKAQLAAGMTSLQDNVWWEGQQGWVPISQTHLAVGGAPAAPGAGALPYPPDVVVASTSKLALWSLIAGCLSLICGIFASIPAIVMGHMSLSEIKKNPGMQGRGMALAGTIIGYIFTALIVVYLISIVLLLTMSNNVKDVFKTINSQLAAQQAADATNNDSNPTPGTPVPSTNAPATTPPEPTTSDTTTNTPSTNAPDGSPTNAAPMNP
jgi:cell division septation protein DedD